MHLQEKTLSSDLKYEGPIFTITHDTAELENGNTADRDVLHHFGGVCVIPITEDNEIFLVKQFRYPFGEITREVPAGKLEKGEDHAEARRTDCPGARPRCPRRELALAEPQARRSAEVEHRRVGRDTRRLRKKVTDPLYGENNGQCSMVNVQCSMFNGQ